MNQTAVLFPVESIDKQSAEIHPSIGELNQFSSSKLMTLPDMPMKQPAASATARQKEKSSAPLNNKRDNQSIQRLALGLQNSFQQVAKTKTHITQLEFILAMEIERKNQTMELFPFQYITQQPRYQPCLL